MDLLPLQVNRKKVFSPFSDDGFSNNEKKSNSTSGTDTPSDLVLRAAEKNQSQKRGIQTSPDGRINMGVLYFLGYLTAEDCSCYDDGG